jgi:aminopeptidase YwaD
MVMKKSIRKPLLSLMLTASISIGGSITYAAPPVSSPASHAFDNKLIKHINVENIYNHVNVLAQSPRVAGTEDEKKAVDYIQKQFEAYGYETSLQPFTFWGYKDADVFTLSVNGDELSDVHTFTYGVNGQVEGEIVYAGLGKREDVANVELDGKIALIKRGELSFAEKVVNAAKAGAKGVLIFNHSPGTLNGTLGGPDESFVPALALTKEQGEAIIAQLDNDQRVTASIQIEGAETTESTSYNVEAKRAASHKNKDTNQIIIVGAHHDSVEGAPGANDDASGTAVTLELARVMAKLPTDTELRFVTFGAEENGLIGSYEYANSLSEDERDRAVGMLQMDMVGSKDAGELIMYTIDGEQNTVTDLGASAGARLNGEPVAYGKEGRSDHEPFHMAGIPAALFIHAPVEPWYHSPEDTIDKISKEKLQDVAEIVGSAVYQAARPDTPALRKAKVAPKTVEYPFEERELES